LTWALVAEIPFLVQLLQLEAEVAAQAEELSVSLADLAEVAQVLHPDQDTEEEQEILPQYHPHKEIVED
jgi:hypothetical protein